MKRTIRDGCLHTMLAVGCILGGNPFFHRYEVVKEEEEKEGGGESSQESEVWESLFRGHFLGSDMYCLMCVKFFS